MPATRKKLVTCRCRTHCRKWNPQTNNFEGDGEDVPRSTRDRHVLDDANFDNANPANAIAGPSNHPRHHPYANNNPGPNRPTPPRIARPAHSTEINTSATMPNIAGVSDEDCVLFIENQISNLSSYPITHSGTRFIFVNDPRGTGAYIRATSDELLIPNRMPTALDQRCRGNLPCMRLESELLRLYSTIHVMSIGEEKQRLVDMVVEVLEKIDWEKEIHWSAQRGVLVRGYHSFNTGMFFNLQNRETPTVRAALLTTLVLNHVYFNTRRATKVLLAGLRTILATTSISKEELARLPLDPRTVSSSFRIHPIVRNFNICERCNTLYPWEPALGPQDPNSDIVLKCQHKYTPGSEPCGHDLWKPMNPAIQDFRLVPRKKYVHQSLKAWLGRLLSRPGIEELLEKRPSDPPDPPDTAIDDIWLSPYFLDLKDSSGSRFYPGTGNEGRLVFSFACDSFDPFYVKTAKQTISSTGMWLVLLNLPPHLRYLHENMHVIGVIPGPEKPSKDAINSYIDLVVDELLEFWEPGVFFSQTHRHPHGRAFKAMLIPVVSDMLAARQAIGHTSSPTSHDLCTQCDLDKDDINILDRTQWPTKSVEHVRRCAEAWRNAPDEAERDRLFNAYGLRWSPLLRLPYWDPVKYTVIDSMHTLDLNLFQTHCRKLFTINTTTNGGDGTISGPIDQPNKRVASKDDVRALRRCVQLIEQLNEGLEGLLLMMPRKVLYTVCVDNGITYDGRTTVTGTKHVLVASILQWRSSDDYPGSVNTDPVDIPQDAALPEVQEGHNDLEPLPKNVTKLIPGLLEDERADDEVYAAGSARAFSLLLKSLNIPYDSSLNLSGRGAKRVLWDLLINRINADPDLHDVLEALIPPPPVNHGRVVLGQDVMVNVWHDMTLSQIPTWVASAPHNWGTARRGKLSAAQWRVVCTIHLPITLISLWGLEEGRKKDLLDHFMHLVSAVQIANMRTSSPRQADAYDRHMFKYVEGVGRLYPDENLRPTHHAALHIGDFLRNMGPVHARSSPFFERYINFFHRVHTNSHVGQLESTLLNASACNANVRALLADDIHIRPQVLHLVETMEAIDSEDIRGFRIASILDPSSPEETRNGRLKGVPGSLTPEHLAAFRNYRNQALQRGSTSEDVRFYGEVARQGVTYGVKGTRSYRNSAVMFSLGNVTVDSVPGIIEAIFSVLGTNDQRVFLCAISQLQKASIPSDPYAQYGFAGGGLYLATPSATVVVELQQITSHAVLTRLDRQPFSGLYHVLPVDRLMNVFATGEDVDTV